LVDLPLTHHIGQVRKQASKSLGSGLVKVPFPYATDFASRPYNSNIEEDDMSNTREALDAIRITYRQTIIVAIVGAITAIGSAAFASPVVRDWARAEFHLANNSGHASTPAPTVESGAKSPRNVPHTSDAVDAAIAAVNDKANATEGKNEQLRSDLDAARAEADRLRADNSAIAAKLRDAQQQKTTPKPHSLR
jgi:hypothetical protein